ncbi:hypothetical protein SmJEL517_g00362 [Synchytrium microbalum]|uniref:Uncharacterized protein n=1 Tax=Synchytrium microbalum TaxID=1806994 RepID=A0A507CK70_9FUNG|nr:uncharacterized protein SmJEL517_g00362 [Synchytrium microbalum]TPX38203.1 hypothetical protein SmJEL517_g00362 [Synchytrium microbalum]
MEFGHKDKKRVKVEDAFSNLDLSPYCAIFSAISKDAITNSHDKILYLLNRYIKIKHFDNVDVIATAVIQKLVDPDPETRTVALNLALALVNSPASRSDRLPFDRASLQQLALSFLNDDEGQVRVAALKALYHLHGTDTFCEPTNYDRISKLTRVDDVPDVRMQAMTLLWAMAHKYPAFDLEANAKRRNGSNYPVWTIENDAFMRFCEMAMDSEKEIRSRAMNFIGTFRYVKEAFILQTLNKQSITSFKRNAGQLDQQWALRSGKDVDYMDNNERLVEISACGAFIHGLEDQHPIVRNAAIDAMCELACRASNSTRFAAEAVTFLIDMFNDEDESVRQNAVSSLFKLARERRIIITIKDLDNVKLILQDTKSSVRQSALDMLGNVMVDSIQAFSNLHGMMQHHIQHREDDRVYVYRCLGKLGKSHALFVHVGNVVLTYNAMSVATSFINELPTYIIRHYPYYRDSFPESVPDFAFEGNSKAPSLNPMLDSSISQIQLFSQQVVEMLPSVLPLVTTPTPSLLESASKMLESLNCRIEHLNSLGVKSIMGSAQFSYHILSVYQIIIKAKKTLNLLTPSQPLRDCAFHIMSITYTLHVHFLGVPVQESPALQTLRLFAHALWVYASIASGVIAQNESDVDLKSKVEELVERARGLLHVCQGQETCTFVYSIASIQPDSVLRVSSLRNAILNAAVPHLMHLKLLRHTHATIDGSKLVGKYTLPHIYELAVTFNVYNMMDTGSIRIHVSIDNTRQSFKPSSTDFTITPFESTCTLHIPIKTPSTIIGPYNASIEIVNLFHVNHLLDASILNWGLDPNFGNSQNVIGGSTSNQGQAQNRYGRLCMHSSSVSYSIPNMPVQSNGNYES